MNEELLLEAELSVLEAQIALAEMKANPYHDPRDGKFAGKVGGKKFSMATGGGGGGAAKPALESLQDVQKLPPKQREVVTATIDAFGPVVLKRLVARNNVDDTPRLNPVDGARYIMKDAYANDMTGLKKKLNYIDSTGDRQMGIELNKQLKEVMGTGAAMKPALGQVLIDAGYGK